VLDRHPIIMTGIPDFAYLPARRGAATARGNARGKRFCASISTVSARCHANDRKSMEQLSLHITRPTRANERAQSAASTSAG
jgi:hypothetical protein